MHCGLLLQSSHQNEAHQNNLMHSLSLSLTKSSHLCVGKCFHVKSILLHSVHLVSGLGANRVYKRFQRYAAAQVLLNGFCLALNCELHLLFTKLELLVETASHDLAICR